MCPLTLERRLAAAQKTIAALMRRVEEGVASGDSAFGVLEQNVALERVVQEKTRQVEAQRRELEDALRDLRQAQSRLVQAQKLESVGRLASGIAHEINTPVQFVSDNAFFVEDSVRVLFSLLASHRALRAAAAAGPVPPAMLAEIDAAEQEADLEFLIENVPRALERSREGLNRVAALVRSMKEFAHPDQREQALADLNRALATTLTIARNEYKYVADVETDYGEVPAVLCHLGELNQVFLNVIVNGAHSIEEALRGREDGKRGLIRVVTRRENDSVVVAISDTGTGIPEAVKDRIFDPFFTTKEVGKGTGQGLAIAHNVVVDKHAGEITFESVPGVGTTFFIRLPIEGRTRATT
jgi:two-component system, NtrC family, sensor kinase